MKYQELMEYFGDGIIMEIMLLLFIGISNHETTTRDGGILHVKRGKLICVPCHALGPATHIFPKSSCSGQCLFTTHLSLALTIPMHTMASQSKQL